MTVPLLVAIIDFDNQLTTADLSFLSETCQCQLFHYCDADAVKGKRSAGSNRTGELDAPEADVFDLFEPVADTPARCEPQADIVLMCSVSGSLTTILELVSVMLQEQLATSDAPFVIVSNDDPQHIYHEATKKEAIVLPILSLSYFKSTFVALASLAREKKQAKLRADEASKVAFSSMVANSQLGETIRFFERSYDAANFDELCSLYLETLNSFGLQGAVLISVDGQSFYRSDCRELVSIEKELRSYQTADRFNQEPFGLVVTFGKVRSVIFNMPALEDETHGRLRDILATLVEGMNFCVQSIAAQISSVVAERTKSLMLSTLSHELKTPMNAIVGFCGILGRKVEGDVIQPRDMLGLLEVKDNVLRLKDLVDDLLSLGDIDEGVVVQERLVLPDLLKEVFDRTTREAAKKSIAFNVAEDIEPELLKSDGKRIMQIVKNLLSNAVKFTAAGHIIYRQSRKLVNGVNFIEISVKDTGIGIEDGSKERIFEPFVQLDMETTRAHEGAGIGLSVAKHMVEQLQGWIELSSMPGSGSEFRIYIPVGR